MQEDDSKNSGDVTIEEEGIIEKGEIVREDESKKNGDGIEEDEGTIEKGGLVTEIQEDDSMNSGDGIGDKSINIQSAVTEIQEEVPMNTGGNLRTKQVAEADIREDDSKNSNGDGIGDDIDSTEENVVPTINFSSKIIFGHGHSLTFQEEVKVMQNSISYALGLFSHPKWCPLEFKNNFFKSRIFFGLEVKTTCNF